MAVLLVFATFIFLNSLFYWYLGKFKFAKTLVSDSKSQPVSVVICAKNEGENLKANIPKILNQEYAHFEVIVVNDGSSDNSSVILQELSAIYPILKIISIVKSVGKKNALTKGIMHASNEIILLTDADCYPKTSHWISQMVSKIDENSEIVLGYGAYEKMPSFLNTLIRYETLLTAIQYFGYAWQGHPYMGVGRNLAYKKSVFLRNNGLESHKDIRSGDDDLFINEVATNDNVTIKLHPESFTISQPESNFNSWFQQKRRHITTSNHYSTSMKLMLGLFYISQLLSWVLFFYLIVSKTYVILTLVLLVFRLILVGFVIKRSSKILKERGLYWMFPILEITLIVVQAALFIANIVSKPKRWA